MRLLYWRRRARRYAFKEFSDAADVKYAILSHRWFHNGEVLFKDIDSDGRPDNPQRKGWEKLRYAIRQAHKDELQYIWIDTCCIDKSSSAELTESINSMYYWYQQATVCYAYLWDVDETCLSITDESKDEIAKLKFTSSEWFKRGWTLQELIAPKQMRFYGKAWGLIGAASTLTRTISNKTNIHAELLTGKRRLETFSFAQRMSWAAERKTTRIEDQAYCMLGIFDVNMPLLYGERERAWVRLQEEIIKRSTDHSIFAWQAPPGKAMFSVFAPSPAAFKDAADVERHPQFWSNPPFDLNNQGLRIKLPIHEPSSTADTVSAAINCRQGGKMLCLNLRKLPSKHGFYTSNPRKERLSTLERPDQFRDSDLTIINSLEFDRAARQKAKPSRGRSEDPAWLADAEESFGLWLVGNLANR